ncbi:DNA methylase N-4/N-6 [Candidatus Nanopelagicaceae bacterium]
MSDVERMNTETESPEKAKLEQLKSILPGVFADGVIDASRLSAEVGIPVVGASANEEGFGLIWAGKKDAVAANQMKSMAALAPRLKESLSWDSAENVLIEGDNLEVLKLLQKAYNDQVKLIYIDPPYNTGSDFVYNDDFSDPVRHYLEVTGQLDGDGNRLRAKTDSSGRKSSKWLSMMYPRMLLARNLLTQDGLILIHIDEHEQANLQLLLDEIFGKENSLGVLVWDKRNPKGDSNGISSQHEYLLAYARSIDVFLEQQGFSIIKSSAQIMLNKAADLYSSIGKPSLPEVVKTAITQFNIKIQNLEEITRINTIEDVRSEYREWLSKQPFSGGELAYNQIDENGDVYQLVSMAWPNKKTPPSDYLIPLIHPKTNKPCAMPERGWRNPSETMKKLLAAGEIAFGKDERTQPRRIYKLKDYMSAALSSIFPYGGSDDALLTKMGVPFDTPKPTELVRQLIASCTSEGDLVLDFFAGSGTTGHAVVLQNELDSLSRRFILVNINEETNSNSEARKKGFNTVSEITRYRISKVFEENVSARDRGLRCFKLGSSNFIHHNLKHDGDTDQLFSKTLVSDINVENIASEILLKNGVKLDAPWKRQTLGALEVVIANNVTVVVGLDLSKESVEAILEIGNIHTLIFLEDAFEGKDALKANTYFACKKANITMKTV